MSNAETLNQSDQITANTFINLADIDPKDYAGLDTLNNGPTQKLTKNFEPLKIAESATIDKDSIPEKVILNLPTETDNVEIRETKGNTITVETYVPINMNDESRNAEINKTLKESFDVQGKFDWDSKTLTLNWSKFDKLLAWRYDPNKPVKYIINLPKSMALFSADGKPFPKTSSDKASENTLDTVANSAKGKTEAEQSSKILSGRIKAFSATGRDDKDSWPTYIQLVDEMKTDIENIKQRLKSENKDKNTLFKELAAKTLYLREFVEAHPRWQTQYNYIKSINK